MMEYWLSSVWNRLAASFFKPKSLLIYDAAKSHLIDEVKSEVKKILKISRYSWWFNKAPSTFRLVS